jgi:probable F420-dependent oxidoreductase
MRFGIALPNFSSLGTREVVTQVAQQAEALGYDSIWTTDHVIMAKGQEEPYGHILEAVTTLSYLAALTELVKLGISVLVFPQRNPVLVAKQLATLDVLSGGRLVVGLGAGWNQREFGFIGADFEQRGKRYDEYIKLLRALWGSTTPSFDGQYVQISDALFSPSPSQVGGPPIVLGGASRATYRRVATLAEGWHATGMSPEAYAAGLAEIRSRANGRPTLASIRLRIAIDRTVPEQLSGSGAVQTVLQGSPAEISALLEAYRAAGVEEVVLYFQDTDASGFVGEMRRFAEEIRPALS